MISTYELQNSYMTQGLYSFSEARHESKRKEHSEVQTGRNMSKTIRARGTWVHRSWDRSETTRNEKTIREQ